MKRKMKHLVFAFLILFVADGALAEKHEMPEVKTSAELDRMKTLVAGEDCRSAVSPLFRRQRSRRDNFTGNPSRDDNGVLRRSRETCHDALLHVGQSPDYVSDEVQCD